MGIKIMEDDIEYDMMKKYKDSREHKYKSTKEEEKTY
jgi:hypothetical protein